MKAYVLTVKSHPWLLPAVEDALRTCQQTASVRFPNWREPSALAAVDLSLTAIFSLRLTHCVISEC